MVLCLLVLGLLPVGAGAKPGEVDARYGTFGSVNISPTLRGAPVSMAVGPENETVVVSGQRRCGQTICQTDFYLSRYGSRGDHDAEFGLRAGRAAAVFNDGRTTLGGPEAEIAVEPDRQVVVATGDQRGIIVTRFNPDGTLDTGFGAGGTILLPIAGIPNVTGVAAARDGSIFVSGPVITVGSTTTSDIFLARLTAGGQLDPRFGSGGLSVFNLTGREDVEFPAGIALRDGAAVVAAACCAGGGAVGVVSAEGPLGRIFKLSHPPYRGVGEIETISTVIARGNGGVILVGSTSESTFVSSHRPNGRLDKRFGRSGITVIPEVDVDGSDAVRDRFGGTVFVGNTPEGRGGEIVIRRVLPSGRPDRNFGASKPLLVVAGQELAEPFLRVTALAAQRDGKIVVLADTGVQCIRTCPSGHWGLIRYIGPRKRPRLCAGFRATITGTRRDDEIVGTEDRDVIAAFAGDDVVRGGAGPDLICGGPGDDRLFGGADNDRLRGGAGRDIVRER